MPVRGDLTMKQLKILPLVALGLLLARSGSAQLLLDRLVTGSIPAAVELTSVRLDGMGNFQTAVRDENRQINLWDFSRNPAGFGDDRDSWSGEFIYDHNESNSNNDYLRADDLKGNDIGMQFGYHRPSRMGLGGFVTYNKTSAQSFPDVGTNLEVAGWGVMGNKYLMKNLSVGVLFSMRGEQNDALSGAIYDISHKGSTIRGGGGVAWTALQGLTFAGYGEYNSISRDGTSANGAHSDNFTWDRSGWIWSGEAFLDRGRLKGALDYRESNLDGREEADLSWSERFPFNPTDGSYSQTTPTFSEVLGEKEFRTRWRLDVVPRTVDLSFAYAHLKQNLDVTANPNRIGSLPQRTTDATYRTYIVGGSWTTLQSRLLLAAEYENGSKEVTDTTTETNRENLDNWVVRAGGEYLIFESLAGRLGVIQENDAYTQSLLGDRTFKSTFLAIGIGVVPEGGIWQLDLAYQPEIRSKVDPELPGVNRDRSRFSAGVRYLF